jgi:transposase-like protein
MRMVRAVARRHSLTPAQLFAWRRKVAHVRPNDVDGTAFARVLVTAPSQANAELTPTIEVIVGALTVRVPAGVDAATLQMVLHAVRAVS